MAMAVPCCLPFYGTACAVGLTWRPLTGSLFLSSFWCRLKPGPSGERGRKSGLLQDMLDTGRPTRTTGGRSSRGLTGNDPRTDRSRSTHKDGRPEPVDGRAQAWTRLALRLVHRNVCETIGHDQPTRMGDRFWQVSPAVRSGMYAVGSHRLSVSSSFLLSCSGASSSSGALGRAPRGTQGLFQDARNKVFSVREELRSRSR